MTRPRARKRALKQCVRKSACEKPPRAKAKRGTKRGVKPGTPSWRRFRYAPELLADCRRRYEATPESDASIARDYGVSARTIGRLAADEGWIKFPSQRVALPRHVQLRRQVEAMAAAHGPALTLPLVGRVDRLSDREGGRGSSAGSDTATTPNPSPQGGGEENAARATQDEEAAFDATLAQLLRNVQVQVGEIAAAQATPKTDSGSRHIASALASLATTLRSLQAMQDRRDAATAATQPAQSGFAHDDTYDDTYDDMPADLDAFRLDLARRIAAFMESRPDDDDAAEAEAPRTDQV